MSIFKKKSMDMTKGNIFRELIIFTIPLIFGNFFQLCYNMVDTIVIGRFGGSDALAAVGTGDPVMSLLIQVVSGVCVGASVLMSRFFGAGQEDRLKDEFKTMITIGLVAAAVILVGGLASSTLILQALQVPGEILGDAAVYLRVIFLGMPFTCLYNIYAAALRSVGNSGTPVRFLMISSILNMCLDLLFVAVFGMGVFGAGLATVIAEGVSAVLCILYINRNVPMLQLQWNDLMRPDRKLALETLNYGGITALQQCAQPIGNLLIQGTINTLGVSSIAAFNAVRKIEDIGLVPGRSISNSMMTFTAQNEGAGDHDRTEEGFRKGLTLEIGMGLLMCLVIFILKRPLMLLFTSDETIIAEGLSYYAVMILAYWMPNVTNGHQGFFRGVKKMKTTLLGTLTQISFRVIFTLALVPIWGIKGVGAACMAGWLAMMAWQIPYRIRVSRQLKNEKKEA